MVLISCAGHVSAQSVNPEETRFLQEMDQYFEKGEEFAQIALPVIANYYYGQAVVGVKSLDEAVTAIYWEHKVKADKEEEQAEVDDLKDDVDFWGMEVSAVFWILHMLLKMRRSSSRIRQWKKLTVWV